MIPRVSFPAVYFALALSLPAFADGPDKQFVTQTFVSSGEFEARHIEDREQVSVIELVGNYDKVKGDGEPNVEPRSVIAREFYRTHPDEYDFLVVFTTFEFATPSNVPGADALAFHLGVRNDVEGIGLPIFDNSDLFGSDGRLQGYIDMAALSRYVTDPLNPRFELVQSTLAHEIQHQWCCYVEFQRPDGSKSLDLLGPDDAHWSYFLDSDASVMYGHEWRDNGNSSFTAVDARRFFSPLDLYLAGFLTPEEMQPFLLIDQPGGDRTRFPERGVTIQGSRSTVDIADIISAEGPRLPAVSDSPKRFRAAFLVVTRPTTRPSDELLAAVHRVRDGFQTRFSILTGGRAVAQVFPEAMVDGSVGAPDGVEGGALRDEASLADGFTWLRNEQKAEGFWEDTEATRLRDTTVSLETLLLFDGSFAGSTIATGWLRDQGDSSVDFLARRAATLSRLGVDAAEIRARLLLLQNPDGGFGIAASYGSDPVDTALAVLALADRPAVPGIALEQAVDYLLASRNADGGWGNLRGGASRTRATTTVLRALSTVSRLEAETDPALGWLAGKQNLDGGFGDSPSTVHDTADVLLTFADLDESGLIRSEDGYLFLRSQQSLDGSWNGSAYATALALTSLEGGSFPNLRFGAPIVASPASPRDGERVELQLSVVNDGGSPSPPVLLRLFEGDPDAGGLPLPGDVSIPALPANRSATVRVLWDSFDKPGLRKIVAVLDVEGSVLELSELDNRTSIDIDVQPAPDGAELEVRSSDVAILPLAPDRLPTTLAISVGLRNLGRTGADARVRLWLGPAETGTLLDEKTTPILERSSRVVHFSYELAVPGTTFFTIEADPENEVPEANESNNVATASVQTAPSVDLEVTDADLALTNGTLFLGNDVTFRARIRNAGTVDAPPAVVRFSITDGVDTDIVATRSVVLAAGATVEQTLDYRIDRLGALRLLVEIDPGGLVPEADETNNVANFAFTSRALDSANLAVSHKDIAFEPVPGLEGSPFRIAALVRNVGVAPATDVEVSFYDGDPSQGGTLLGSLQVIPAVGPGTSAAVEVVLPSPFGVGDRLIFVVVDPANRIAEFDENDNRAFESVRVLRLPDLATSPGALSLSPRFPRAGESVTLTVSVTNLGEQPTGTVLIRAFEGDPASGGSPVGGDQSLLALAPQATGTVSFSWLLASGPPRPIVVVVDPDGIVVESTKANNTARIDVAVQDSDFYVTNRYFSPNGDGIQDTTRFFYRLGASETALVQVTDSRGRVVRRSPPIEAEASDFEWDGLDELGRLARDGDYRLEVLRGADVRGQALVTLDTDRSSLIEALETPLELRTNLTCEIAYPGRLTMSPDERWVYFTVSFDPLYPEGIYRASSLGGDLERISEIVPWNDVTISPDSSRIAFSTIRFIAGAWRYEAWVANGDGTSARVLRQRVDTLPRTLGFIDGGRTVLVAIERSAAFELEAIPLDGSDSRLILSAPIFTSGEYALSPRGTHLLMGAYDGFGFAQRLVNLSNGTSVLLPSTERPTWSPDGGRFATVSRESDTVAIYDDTGNVRRTVSIPVDPIPPDLLPPDHSFDFDGLELRFFQSLSWSRSGTELAFLAEYGSFDVSFRRLFRLDVVGGELETIGWSEPLDEEGGDSYHVSAWDGGSFVEKGVLHYGLHYQDQEVALSADDRDPSGEVRIRIRQTGREAAHVDAVALQFGALEIPPSSAIRDGDAKDALAEVRARDSEVLDLHEAALTLVFDQVPPGPVKLVLRAREETLTALRERNARPFAYPGEADRYFDVALNPSTPLEVDGVQTGGDDLGQPLFEELSRPGTGHPAAKVSGWAKSDGENLYAALDFTVDNTLDGDKDWAALLVRSGGSFREFRVTAKDSRWGVAGFTRTGRAQYTHKYYEFKIPLTEIGARDQDVLQLRFQAYGTAASLDSNPDFLPSFGDVLWVPNERTLLYASSYSARASEVIFLDEGNRREPVFESFDSLSDSHFTPTGRKFLFRGFESDTLDLCSLGGSSDFWAVSSLANLTADVRARRISTGSGIRLDGTAADRNFSHYTLEYARPSAPGAFTLIQPASSETVIDDFLTTWVPPSTGSFFVRLSSSDLAGNLRSHLRRVSYSDTPSITDVYRTPDFISPNGDGVQDELLVHYRVLEPVHLEFQFVNESGDRVRTIQRDHSLPGVEFTLAWNGIDDRGLPVKDGEYRLLVQGYEFFFHVDTRAPELELSLHDAYQVLPVGEPVSRPFVIVRPRLEWCIEEEHLSEAFFESGEGADPAFWQEHIEKPNPPCLDEVPEERRVALGGLRLPDFVNHRFRLEARDRAGNFSQQTTGLGREELIVRNFGLPNENDVLPLMPYVAMDPTDGATGEGALFQIEPGGLRIRVAETVRAEIVEVAIQYRPLAQTFWQETPATEFLDFSKPKALSSAPFDHVFDIPWNLAGVPLGIVTAVRLRATDLEGTSYFSNAFQVQTDGVIYGGYILPDSPLPPPEPDIVHQLAEEAIEDGLITVKAQALWAIEAIPERLAEIKLFIQSSDDPRYLSWKSFDPIKVVNGGFIFRFDGAPCVSYDSFVKVKTEPTPIGDGRLQVRTFETGHIPIVVPCLAVRVEVSPVPAPSCGADPPQQLILKAFPAKAAFSPDLQLLVVGEPLGEGEIDVRFNVNHPEANLFGLPETFYYTFVLDISDREEGIYPFVARLTNIAGDRTEASFDVIVDHTPPVARVLVPLEGQRVCGIPRQTEDGIRNVFDVEGVVEDEAGADYTLRLTRIDGLPRDIKFEETRGLAIHEAHGTLGTYGDNKFEPPFAGETTFQLETTDWGGFLQCTERNFFFDGEVEDADTAIDRTLFSPNGDGNLDELELEVRASELFFATIDVHGAVEATPGRLQITGPSLRRLASDLLVLNESILVWDGRRDDGGVVPDGLYGIVVSFRDACGNIASSTRYVVVDNTPPVVAIRYPRTGDPLGLIVEVLGTASDLHFVGYGVEFGIGSDPSTWARFGAGRTPRIDELLAAWNTRGLEGDVTLRLVASDLAGNQAETRVPLLFETRVDLLSYFEAIPALFSPNGDGRREETGIRFGLLSPAKVTLSVTDAAANPIATLTSAESLAEGPFIRPWDGRKGDGTEAPDGSYSVEILAASTANAAVTQRERLTVVVDRTPPSVSLLRPTSGFATGGDSAVGTIEDLHLAEYSISLAETPDAPIWSAIAEGTSNRRDAALASLFDLEEGDYALRVEASDEAENRAALIVSFIIDSTPPRVSLSSPLPGSVLGGTALEAPVSGSVEEEHLDLYRLEFGEGESPSSFTPISTGTSLPLPDPAGLLDLSALQDGRYTLRLFARDKAGLTGEARILFDVDKTPPSVEIASPPEGSLIQAPLPIQGTATDEHFVEYRLFLAPGRNGASSSFSEIGLGVSPVDDGILLEWSALPKDGFYTLKLRAQDLVGLTSETLVEVEVDTTPPAPPLSLTATVEDRRNGRLIWTANTEPDLAGYRVYRHGEVISGALVPTPTFLDEALEEGRYVYTVTAVDRGGLESDPSNEASLAIDVTPPEARIFVPSDGSRVSGLVDVTGTAYSQDDFRSYRLLVTGATGSSLLRESPVPIQADVLSQWNTIGLPEDAAFTLRLEAEDTSGNVAFHEVAVTIDNLPPAAPTGLTAIQQGTTSNVLARWNPNTEPDLLGYLLYRDGRLANATGVVIGDLRRYIIKPTQFLDLGVPDGLHTYEVYAMDEAGNVSDPSNQAEVTLDTRPPHAVIVLPADGTAFDTTLHVIAETVDTDVDVVRFQFRAAVDVVWTDIGDPDIALPWETDWDPSGLAFGPYELRAVATDEGGRTDPAPTPVGVHYRDVTRPGGVLALDARVDGGDVHLAWEAVADSDLAGYHIDRRDSLGSEIRITSSPIGNTSYVDSGLDDGTYIYRVVAVDTSDNEGDPSNEAEAHVYTPFFDQPYTPTPELSFSLLGFGEAFATTEGTIAKPSGVTDLPATSADARGHFTYDGLALERGDNVVSLRLRDAEDNVSKGASVTVVSGALPSAPVDVVAESPGGLDVSLNWTENPAPENVIGYRPFRNGEAVLPDTDRDFSGATASSFFYSPPANAVDSDPTTYWAPAIFDGSPVDGQWLEAEIDEPAVIAGLLVRWWEVPWDPRVVYAAVDYDVEAWSGESWVRIHQIRANSEAENRVLFSRPYRTDRIRVVLRTALQADPFEPVRLAEVQLVDRPYVPAPPYEEAVVDGRYSYTVTALNDFGFEGPESSPAELPVGDVVPPEPPVLTAAVLFSDVTLSWTASLSPDVVRYDLYRDGDLIAQHTDLLHLDASRPNGVYRYIVRAVDAVGNESAPSNEAEATVSVAPPEAPIDLVVTEVPEGRALDLAWAPGAGLEPASYLVFRATTSGGPYEEIGTTPETSYRDTGLDNGVTYFYVVVGLDAIGNKGASSNEASGTPRDVTQPTKPVLHYPGFPGAPFRTLEDRTLIAGLSEPGASVRLNTSGSFKGSARALLEPETATAPVLVFDPQLSPTGRYLFDAAESVLFDFDRGVLGAAVPVQGPTRFSADGKDLWIARDSGIFAYRIADQNLEEVTQVDFADLVVPSPDGDSLALLAYLGSDRGLMLIDRETGAARVLVEGETWMFDAGSIQWSPGNSHIAYQRWSPFVTIEIVNVETAEILLVESEPIGSRPSWSPDGESLVYSTYRDGFEQVWRYDLSTRVASPVTTDPRHHGSPQWSPDGSRIAYRVEDQVLARDWTTGEESVLFQSDPGSFPQLQWSRGGDLLILSNGAPLRLRPAGRFELQNVTLAPGDNVFTATARDDSGIESEASDPMVVVLEVSDRPDLDVSLSVLPAAARVGAEVQVTVAVRNAGGSPASPVELSVVAAGPGGFSRTLAERRPLGELAPGALRAVYFTLRLDGAPGVYRIAAAADPLEQISEQSESNNVAERQVLAVQGDLPELAISTDRPTYRNEETVVVSAELFHAGDPFDGRLSVTIEDSEGFEVEPLFNRSVDSLGFGESRTETADWNTGTTFAGGYRARARLVDMSGALVAESLAPFRIASASALSGTVATDRGSYVLGATARITGVVGYGNGNSILRGLIARLRVVDAAGQVLREWSRPLGDLLPGGEGRIQADWETSSATAGTFEAELAVLEGTNDLAPASSEFDVTISPLDLTGRLTLSDSTPSAGSILTVNYRLENAGSQGLSSLPVFLRVFHPATAQIVAEHELRVDLGPGASASGSHDFPTTGLSLEAYFVTLSAHVPGDAQPTKLHDLSFVPVDETPPRVQILSPVDGLIDDGILDALVTAVDDLSMVRGVELALDEGEWLKAALSNLALGRYLRSLSILVEGEHRLRARATDAWENTGETGPVRFIVDRTPPRIVITGVQDGGTYHGPVTPVIEVTDAHPKSETITLNGAPFVSGTTLSAVGTYLLEVEAEDAASNRSQASVSFEIEGTPSLAATKRDELMEDGNGDGAAGEGDVVRYVLEIRNEGDGAATGVVLVDPLPGHTTLVPGSITTTLGVVESESPVRVALGELAASAMATIIFEVRIEEPLSPQVDFLENQGTVSSAELPDLSTDDPDTADAGDPTRTPLAHESDWIFTDETVVSGLGTPGVKTGGLAWCDFNEDGYLDLLVNGGSAEAAGRSYLYFNQGDGSFRDVTATHGAGIVRKRAHRSAVCGDLDNDGDLDFARNEQGRIEIYRNRGSEASPPWSFGKTVNKKPQEPNQLITSISGGMNTEGMGLLDFDNDGDLDLVVDNHDFGIDLFKNDGEGELSHSTTSSKPRGFPTKAKSGDYLAVADYDANGFVDLIDRKEKQYDLWVNRGDGTVQANTSFDEEASNANKGGVAFCDLDSDGDFDVLWTDAGVSQIWRNDGGTFRPAGEPGASSGIDLSAYDIDDVSCADVDNDSDLDVFLSASSGPSFLFFNETVPGSASPFLFVRGNRNITVEANGEATAFADYDRDGDLDLVVNVDGASNQLWQSHRSEAGANDYLAVRALRCMEGETCEDDDHDDEGEDDSDHGDDDDDDHDGHPRTRVYRDDIGATIRLLDANGLVPVGPVREVSGGRGHGTQDPAVVHFGLPLGSDHRYVVEVRFIGGDGRPGRVIRKEVVPAEMSGYRLLEITSCEGQNRPPVARDVEVETRVGVEVEVKLRATDPDSDPLEYIVVSPPRHGQLTGVGPTLRYRPEPGFEGEDSFTYKASDGRAESNTARVEIEIECDSEEHEEHRRKR